MECSIHSESVTETKLIALSSLESWQKLVDAAKVRDHEGILKIDEQTPNGDIPEIKYHKSCRSLFINKKSLLRIKGKASSSPTSSSNSRRSENRKLAEKRECDKLPKICMFCSKEKFFTKQNLVSEKEKLLSCMELRADEKIRICSIEKNDDRIMALCSDDLIAKEASYHKSCYRNYTREQYQKKDNYDVFPFVKCLLDELYKTPRIMEFKEITDAVENEMQHKDMPNERIQNAKKNLRQRIEQYLKDFKFVTVQRQLYIFPNSLILEDVVKELILLRKELKEHDTPKNVEQCLTDAAFMLRNDIKSMKNTVSWPPCVAELDVASMDIGEPLSFFLNVLLSGNIKESMSSRIVRLRSSFGQDLIYAVSNGVIRTPKSVVYPAVLKSLTNNTELISINNKLGHGVSKTTLEEIFTENAFQLIDKEGNKEVPIPNGIVPQIFTLAVHDNIDRLEETLSGAGTTHRVNGILIQHGMFGNRAHKDEEYQPKPKKRKPSFVLPCRGYKTIQMKSGKRIGPAPMVLPESQEREILFSKQELHNLLFILSRKTSIPQVIPSWTGFNIKIRSVDNSKATIGYLESIDSPATQLSTVYEILERCLLLKEKLGLQVIVCVFDQAIYAKAVEIKWKDPVKYRCCIIILGMFHMVMMYLGVIGKRYQDAGMRDILLQSEVISAGSVDSALSGKMYNRAVRSNKLLYEALYRLLLHNFEEQIRNTGEQEVIDQLCTQLAIFCDDVSEEGYRKMIERDELKKFYMMFTQFRDDITKNGSQLARFWLSYLQMVELLLNTLYSVRTGSWHLLLECIRDIAAYAFAYDRYNYARYLTPFLAEMLTLESEFPDVYQEFVNGNFAVQLSDVNPFGRVEPDKVIETTINRDTKTPGGTTGFSTNHNTVIRWTLNAPYRASMLSSLRDFVKLHNTKHQHKDISDSRIKKDECDIRSLLSVLTETFIHPFSDNPLLNISNGMVASDEVAVDLLEAKSKGKLSMNEFVEKRLSNVASNDLYDPMKKLKLKTFSSMKKIVPTAINKKMIPIKASRTLFTQIALIMERRKLDLKEVFSYPLAPIPWSLADGMGALRKTSKVSILHELEKGVDPFDGCLINYVSLIDGMAMIHKIQVQGLTFGSLSKKLLHSILFVSSDADRIDVIFDTYIENSIKEAERIKRSKAGSIKFQNIKRDHPIKQWSNFLSCNENKTELIHFLVKEWSNDTYFESSPVPFYVTSGQSCYKLTEDGKTEVEELATCQEEADTRLFLHLNHSNCAGFNNFIIHSPDTDVFLLALSFLHTLNNKTLYFKTGTRSNERIINLKAIRDSLQNRYCNVSVDEYLEALVGLHAFTGCDTVSCFSGQGKIKALKLMTADSNYTELFRTIGNSWNLEDKVFARLESFTCHLYGSKCNDINELRYKLYCAKRGNGCENLPPCRSTLYQHCLRANYQSKIWRSAMVKDQIIPSPHGYGWIANEEGIFINWMNCKPAPDEILEFLSCECRTKCVMGKCSCIDNGLSCTNACRLKDCDNVMDSEDEYQEFSSDSEPDDFD